MVLRKREGALRIDRFEKEEDPRFMVRWICWYAVAGLLGCMLVSAPMWWSHAGFPHIPLWGRPEGVAPLLSPFLLASFLVLVLAGSLWQEQAWLMGVASLCLVGLLVTDLVRFQPWALHFALLLLLWGLLKPLSTRKQANDFLWMACWILGILYFWSGWHKFQPLFGKNSVFVAFSMLPSSWQSSLVEQWGTSLGYVVASLEMLFALLLFFSRSRRWGVILLSLMHIDIIGSLLWMKHDVAVIPWNLTCLGFLWMLFWNKKDSLWQFPIVSSWREIPVGFLFFFFVIMPALHTFDRWDPNLSFALYSGNYPRPRLLGPPSLHQRFPSSMQIYVPLTTYYPIQSSSNGRAGLTKSLSDKQRGSKHSLNGEPPGAKEARKTWTEVDLYGWALGHFQATAPPSLSFYRAALRVLCRRYPGEKLQLIWRTPFTWFRTKRPYQVETCRSR